jgi:hypothetical protein
MHCPKCGEPLAFDEARFCRRCGFEIVGVKEFLARGSDETKPDYARRKSFKQAMTLTVACLIAIIINIVLRDAFSISPVYGKLIIVSLLALATLKMVMSDALEKKMRAAKARGMTSPTTRELEPPSEYINDFRAFNQAERPAPPPSVTESTTRLLDERDADGVALANSNTDN